MPHELVAENGFEVGNKKTPTPTPIIPVRRRGPRDDDSLKPIGHMAEQ
jgi:hypothetical protein